MSKGIIFDFNGTLFWDTDFHNRAWDKFLSKKNMNLSNAEKIDYLLGRSGKDIFEYLYNRALSPEEIYDLTEEKEALYREECEQQKIALAPGAEELLEYLVANHIPISIATASVESNVDYFFMKFNLHKYFSRDTVVYDDGVTSGKPNPDMFLIAMNRLGLDAMHSIIFEDSPSGIKAAENAKAGRIIIVNSTNREYSSYPYSVINHFHDFDRAELFDV